MSKGLVIAAVIIGAGVIGVGAYFVFSGSDLNNNQTNDTTSSSQAVADTKTSDQQSNASINKLLAENQNRACTFNFEDDGAQLAGTAYFAEGEQARMNYTHSKDGATTDGSMIITENSQTFWDNNTKKGFIYKTSAEDTTSQEQGVDTNKDINFKCVDWSVDTGYFSPPTEVTIIDLSSITAPVQP